MRTLGPLVLVVLSIAVLVSTDSDSNLFKASSGIFFLGIGVVIAEALDRTKETPYIHSFHDQEK